jgi:predicted Zn finger-like uncharacterized protein
MVIQCENCKRNFRLEDSRIKPPGSSVRCSKCGHIFFVSKTEDLRDERELGISQKTPLFEDLKEEIATEERSNDYLEKKEPLSGSLSDLTQSDLTQGKLSIGEVTDETDSDILDLPTGHNESLEEFIDREVSEVNKTAPQTNETRDLELRETDSNLEEVDTELETQDSIPAPPELFEAEDSEESNIVRDESYSGIKLEEEDTQIINNTGEEDFGESHNREASYTSSQTHIPKSGAGIFAKTIYTLITITALFVIFIASVVILINAEILPKGTLSNLTTLVESIIPLELNNAETKKVIITEHSGKWMNTVNGEIYIVSGLITNESQAPVHYVKLKSEYIAGEKIQFEDIFYAGNTFTDNELKASPIGNILSKLKQKNGDIDVNNSRKLAGLNYNIQPGESIPFFTVFPADGRVLGLRYNLEVIDYKEADSTR